MDVEIGIDQVVIRRTSPEQRLACHVVVQAFNDCRRLYLQCGYAVAKKSEAYLSLAYPNAAMKFWIESAGFDPAVVSERVRKAMQRETSAHRFLTLRRGHSQR